MNENKCFFVVTKHHGIVTAVVNGQQDFQIPQANEKEDYKQIKTYFMFYILFTIHSTQYARENKEKKLLFTFISPVLFS